MKIAILILCIILLLGSITAKNHNANKAYGWENNLGHWLGTAISVFTDIACGYYIINYFIE